MSRWKWGCKGAGSRRKNRERGKFVYFKGQEAEKERSGDRKKRDDRFSHPAECCVLEDG